MGVSAKGRRTITYKEQKYIWWVAPYEDDGDRIYLRILSEDKSIILRYRVGDGSFIVVSEGRLFQGQKQTGTAKLYRLPMEESIDVVTPKIVAELIEWAVYGKDAVPVR